jgi:hypothetical protein
MAKSLTFNELETEIYEFCKGVLPAWIDTDPSSKNLGFYIRITGYSHQQNPIHWDVLRKNHCYINLENSKALYLENSPDPSYVLQAMQFVYSIKLQNQQTNLLLDNSMLHAARLTAHRHGYDLFEDCGIVDFKQINQKVIANAENTMRIVTLKLIINASIKLSNVSNNYPANSVGISIYDHGDLIYKIN